MELYTSKNISIEKFKFYRIEIFIFTFALFFQNFSIIHTKSFGISFLTIILILIGLRKKFIFLKVNKKLIFFIIYIILNQLILFFLSGHINYIKIFRFLMIFLILLISNEYLKEIFLSENKKNCFEKNMFFFINLILIYGIYSFIAPYFKFPLFFNVFQNNPSYAVRDMYDYYGGWVESTRIYTFFFEPSVYSIFCIFMYIWVFYVLKSKKKYIYFFLIFLNIFLTFSRTGIVSMLIILFFNVFLKKRFFKKIINKKFFLLLIYLIPLIILWMMNFANRVIFNDLSSSARTLSAIYYLNNSFSSYFLIGRGLGYIQFNYIPTYIGGVEKFAHNGLIEMLYEFGILVVMIVFFHLKNITKHNKTFLMFVYFCSINSFGTYYYVETIVLTFVIIFYLEKTQNSKYYKSKYIIKRNRNIKLYKLERINNEKNTYSVWNKTRGHKDGSSCKRV